MSKLPMNIVINIDEISFEKVIFMQSNFLRIKEVWKTDFSSFMCSISCLYLYVSVAYITIPIFLVLLLYQN